MSLELWPTSAQARIELAQPKPISHVPATCSAPRIDWPFHRAVPEELRLVQGVELHKLDQPTQHLRIDPAPLHDGSKTCKIGLMIKLRIMGWRQQDDCADFDGSNHLFKPNFKAPFSYFKALVDSDMILAKKVNVIAHDKPDGYYRCLLQMPSEPLLELLSQAGSQPHNWFGPSKLLHSNLLEGGVGTPRLDT